MDAAAVKNSLCEVITDIQTLSGLECPPLNGGTRPARDVKDFSSEIWPIAIAMLEEKTGVAVPEDDNLFYDPKLKAVLTIDQCVERVLLLAEKQPNDQTQKEAPDE